MDGFILKLPDTLRDPPAPTVKVVAVAVAEPKSSAAQTAAVVIVRFIPELITAVSVDVGTCPRLQVAVAQLVPAVAVLVCAFELNEIKINRRGKMNLIGSD